MTLYTYLATILKIHRQRNSECDVDCFCWMAERALEAYEDTNTIPNLEDEPLDKDAKG